MMISAVSINQKSTNRHISFCSGKSILYTDFDGTFLAQPLHDIYNPNFERKQNGVNNFNKYFGEIQDFVDAMKGKFEIIITTGRRLTGLREKGFESVCQEIQEEGVKLPKIAKVITSDGGDIHEILPNGTINGIPDAKKTKLVKRLSGWDTKSIAAALNQVSYDTGISHSLVNPKGTYKLSVKLSDESRAEEFLTRLNEVLKERKIKAKTKTAKVKHYFDTDGRNYTLHEGIKMEPAINGHHMHKDFDTKRALYNAIRRNDFLIVAGDASNDKQMLNIFNYIKRPKGTKVPYRVGDITYELIDAAKSQVQHLPLKILFIKSPDIIAAKKEQYEFMMRLQEIFPNNVQVVEETIPGVNNNFLEAIKTSIKNHDFSRSMSRRRTILYSLATLSVVLGSYKLLSMFFKKRPPHRIHKLIKPTQPDIPKVFVNFKNRHVG